jgi:hypothetical protein
MYRIWPLQMVEQTESDGVWALIPRSEFGHAANHLKSVLVFSCTFRGLKLLTVLG